MNQTVEIKKEYRYIKGKFQPKPKPWSKEDIELFEFYIYQPYLFLQQHFFPDRSIKSVENRIRRMIDQLSEDENEERLNNFKTE